MKKITFRALSFSPESQYPVSSFTLTNTLNVVDMEEGEDGTCRVSREEGGGFEVHLGLWMARKMLLKIDAETHRIYTST
jgi:hypothetical protein